MTPRPRGTSFFPLPLVAAGLALILVSIVPTPAHATGKFGLGIFGSWNSYAMDDLNDDFIGPLNDSLETAGSSARLEEVDGGFGFGGGIRYMAGTNLLFALDYERLSGDTKATEGGAEFKIDVPANAFTATVSYLLTSSSSVRFGFGGGLGYYSSAGDVSLSDPTVTIENDLEGSGIGFHAGGVLDAALSDQASLNVFAGWRQAKTSDLEIDGDKVLTSDGDEATLDWSGIMVKVGVNVFFGMTGAQ